jgi:hypothetical protein
LAVLLGRLLPALGKLPSDPGYDFVAEVEKYGLRSFAQASEKYIQVAPRLAAWVALWFPMADRAIVLQMLSVFLLVLLAVLIAWSIEVQTESRLLGTICGVGFITIPAASESTIGNAGSLKWPLLAGLGVIAVCPRFIGRFVRFTSLFTFFVGVSSPMFVVAVLPIVWFAISDRSQVRKLRPILLAISAGFLIQGYAWIAKNRQVKIYGESGQQSPWPGMGVFWYLVWLGPTVVGIAVICSTVFARRRQAVTQFDLYQSAFWLATIAIALSWLVWISAGIKDSAAVATQSLAWVAALLIAYTWLTESKRHQLFRLVGGITCLMFALFAVKWFSVSQYLSGGPTWSSEVRQAALECKSGTTDQVEIQLNLAIVELPCSTLR